MFRALQNLLLAGTLLLVSACSNLVVQDDSGREQPPQGPFQPPHLSVTGEQAITLETAYRHQRSAVLAALDGRSPAGFKAGLTSVAGQQRFKLREPIAGVLWPDSALRFDGDKAVISSADFRKPMLEMELAFRVNTLIPEPLADVSEVQYVVSEVMPALEIPDLGFDSTVGTTGEAIVAANVGARAFLLGPALVPETVDINAVRARLRLDGSTLQRGEATQVMGNQWKALFWLINTMVEQGWVIQPGQVLLTGAMGEIIPLDKGVYEAHFTGLGHLRLQVD